MLAIPVIALGTGGPNNCKVYLSAFRILLEVKHVDRILSCRDYGRRNFF